MINKLATAALRAGLGDQIYQSGVDPSTSFPVLDKIIKGVDFLGRQSINGLMLPGRDPSTAALAGLGVGAAYDITKRLRNSKEENDNESGIQRGARYAIPAAGLGLLGSLTNSTFSDYYKYYPHFKA